MIIFSLNKQISIEKIIKEIEKLIKKEINSQEKANNSVLKISIQTVVEHEEIKKLN